MSRLSLVENRWRRLVYAFAFAGGLLLGTVHPLVQAPKLAHWANEIAGSVLFTYYKTRSERVVTEAFPRDLSEVTVSALRSFVRAQRAAWLEGGSFAPLHDLNGHGFGEDDLDALIHAVDLMDNEYPLVDTANRSETHASLLLPFDGQSYVLAVYKHRYPFFISWEPGAFRINFDAVVVMSPGMWQLALRHPDSFPKVADELSGRLLDKSQEYSLMRGFVEATMLPGFDWEEWWKQHRDMYSDEAVFSTRQKDTNRIRLPDLEASSER